jgi:hypothetical protein
MEVQLGIQPNCSECALVIYPTKLKVKQHDFFQKWIKERNLTVEITPMGNYVIETGISNNPDYKDGLWVLRDSILELSKHLKLGIYEDKEFSLIRDDSYYDLKEEKRI